MKKILQSSEGFSLIEIMIAMTIFAVFIAVYVTSQGGNLADSTLMREEIILRQLAEDKINEIIISPPELKSSLTLSKDTKTFEKYPNYEYTVEWKKFKVPELSKIKGQTDDGDSDEGNLAKASGVEKTLFNKIKENLEKIIWQVEVTARNKETQFSFSASTWIYNDSAEVKIDGY